MQSIVHTFPIQPSLDSRNHRYQSHSALSSY